MRVRCEDCGQSLAVAFSCKRRGLLEPGADDSLSEKEPLLASITAASIRGQVATGERVGQRPAWR